MTRIQIFTDAQIDDLLHAWEVALGCPFATWVRWLGYPVPQDELPFARVEILKFPWAAPLLHTAVHAAPPGERREYLAKRLVAAILDDHDPDPNPPWPKGGHPGRDLSVALVRSLASKVARHRSRKLTNCQGAGHPSDALGNYEADALCTAAVASFEKVTSSLRPQVAALKGLPHREAIRRLRSLIIRAVRRVFAHAYQAKRSFDATFNKSLRFAAEQVVQHTFSMGEQALCVERVGHGVVVTVGRSPISFDGTPVLEVTAGEAVLDGVAATAGARRPLPVGSHALVVSAGARVKLVDTDRPGIIGTPFLAPLSLRVLDIVGSERSAVRILEVSSSERRTRRLAAMSTLRVGGAEVDIVLEHEGGSVRVPAGAWVRMPLTDFRVRPVGVPSATVSIGRPAHIVRTFEEVPGKFGTTRVGYVHAPGGGSGKPWALSELESAARDLSIASVRMSAGGKVVEKPEAQMLFVERLVQLNPDRPILIQDARTLAWRRSVFHAPPPFAMVGGLALAEPDDQENDLVPTWRQSGDEGLTAGWLQMAERVGARLRGQVARSSLKAVLKNVDSDADVRHILGLLPAREARHITARELAEKLIERSKHAL